MSSGILTCNKKVACTPFETRAIEASVSKGFAVIRQKTELIGLTVVFPPQEPAWICAGDLVWVRGESSKLAWATDEYELEGQKFILVPLEAIQLCGRDE